MLLDTFQKLQDDTAPFSFVERNGYYRVGEQNFNYKINALEAATRNNLPVTWEFNSEVYKKLNWKSSTGVGLDNLYRMRAQQLRNKYDYLVLAFSGGADSYTVLRSFIDNNIHLDEIVCDWPLAQTEKLNVSSDLKPENYSSEWDLAIKPVLEYIAQHHPEIKITVTDSIQTLSVEDYEDTCTVTQIHNYVSIKRYRKISARLRTLADQYQKVALVLGIEKPQFSIYRGLFCAYFSDAGCWFKSTFEDYARNVEYFYWTPDLPEIVLEQTHVIYQQILKNKNLLQFFDPKINNFEDRLYTRNQRDFVKSQIYPKWNPTIFQADKGSSLIYNEQYAWFFSQDKTREIESWESSMNSRLRLVDDQYLNFFADQKFRGYKEFSSRIYPLGPI